MRLNQFSLWLNFICFLRCFFFGWSFFLVSSVFLLLLLSFFTSLNIGFLESFLLFYLFSFRYLMIRNNLCYLYCLFNFLFINSIKFLFWLFNSLFCCSYSMLFGLLSQNPESFFLCFKLRLFNFISSAIFNNA
ncbi:hypothetical protein PanWU01x14_036190, partial [Parasponia andersonii]